MTDDVMQAAMAIWATRNLPARLDVGATAKHVPPGNCWWNVVLLGQRHPANKDFKLE